MNKPDLKILKKYEPICVIGHSHIDVDSAVSSKIFSSILNFFGIKSYYAILDKNYDFDEFNKKMINDCMDFNPIIINQKDINNHNYFLIDHNDRTQSVGVYANVIGALDHHPKANNVENTVIGDTCSISLYLYKIYRDEYNFTDEEKYQIFMAFLSDSSFGMSSRFHKSDKVLADKLGYGDNYDDLFKKYFIATDTSNNFKNALHNGNKKYLFGNISFESSYVETLGTSKLNDYKELIKTQKNFLGIWFDYKNKNTYAFLNYEGHFIEKEYDYIASRSTTILKDIMPYLNKKTN